MNSPVRLYQTNAEAIISVDQPMEGSRVKRSTPCPYVMTSSVALP
jgi:hypothetical protein